MVALELLAMAAVFTVNVAQVAAATTVTDVGTITPELLVDSPTLAPPAGAACVRLTVQLLDAFAPKALGLHASEDTLTPAFKVTEVVAELPL